VVDLKVGKGSDVLRVTRKTFNGVEYVDVRRWYINRDTNEYAPTQKGVMIPVEMCEQVIAAIKQESES